MANNPELLKMPLARDGQKSTIPETTDASTGLFSQQYGWQSINSLPPQAGGKAVKREDFNGAFNLLGGIAFMAQKGFTFKWSADQDYYAGCMVIDDTDGLRYECISDVTANNTAPSADATHWQLANNGTDIDAWFRQANTQYDNGAITLLPTLPTGLYLECTGTGGTTSASDLVITSPAIGDTVTDGTVVWIIRAVASTADIPAPVDISGKANVDLDNLSAAGLAMIQQYGGGIIAQNLATNGYVKFENGLIIQWGHLGPGSADQTVSFPIAFSSAVYAIAGLDYIDSDTGGLGNTIALANAKPTTSEFRISKASIYEVYWMAVGK
jgi:hypothetical protein